MIYTVPYIEQNGVFPVASIQYDQIYRTKKTEIMTATLGKVRVTNI